MYLVTWETAAQKEDHRPFDFNDQESDCIHLKRSTQLACSKKSLTSISSLSQTQMTCVSGDIEDGTRHLRVRDLGVSTLVISTFNSEILYSFQRSLKYREVTGMQN